MPLSMTPSQSLSLASQISCTGLTPPTQESTPPLHWSTPGLHSPTFEPQAVPTFITPLSMLPSQSLSLPSHTSGTGVIGLEQVQAPPAHTSTPWLQVPPSVPLSVQLAPIGGH